ncbi:LAMI_0F07030g1_1 [Lachancea mirantina]|uniref:LAMI_0F07030g1_1 n=1 Tax=Lachancea mirantina TaxID=1230905 RepID=A0A1G4JZE6_9SACH|nr:LAMI_0F07030g1_1 [Lachancea mirantina]
MFAAIASGNPLQLSTEVPNSNGLQHTIILSSTKPKSYSHISLFILPNVTFPPEFAATVYFKLSPTEEFKLFGYLALEKPSAIFKVKLPAAGTISTNDYPDGLGEIDMDDDDEPSSGAIPSSNISELIIGISIEPREQAMLKLEEWKAKQQIEGSGSALIVSRPGQGNISTPGQLAKRYPQLTQQLAAKIVQHAYNYLTGFLDPEGNVSIKRFDSWWEKFRVRLENDGQFLDEVTKD